MRARLHNYISVYSAIKFHVHGVAIHQNNNTVLYFGGQSILNPKNPMLNWTFCVY